MPDPDVERLRAIKSFPSLVKYLRDELDWPIQSDDFEDLFFEYKAEELGIDAKTAAKVNEIKQLRPLTARQPWGIFFINFEPKQLPVVALRRILQSLVIKKRLSANRAHQPSWKLHDLLFISAYGETDHRDLTFAHFQEDKENGDLPTLKVLGWDDEDTVLHLDKAHKTLKEKLQWPEKTEDIGAWRDNWSEAFILEHKEVPRTSKALAMRMAKLATAIRKRVNRVLAIETDKGPLRKLMAAFRETLIHDLKEDDFADMYAQTITYGLLAARVSRPAGLVADNLADMIPNTNPFLRDLLGTFLTIGGRKGKIDFDELGINDVVQALRDADMEAVQRDFGDKNPQEDPVIHFYELFLKEYDAKKRMQRGVFYTPRPVVSYIVRSVDEILRTEFGLEDGLADTTTWGEMAKKYKGLKIPRGALPDDPFVQILDPACGTGTFLVEVIVLVHHTMLKKWEKEKRLPLDFDHLWKEYVADHLLPRLYGYELMMAPYAIAHMKIGLKLFETGYRFGEEERARVYLTNSLEPPQDFSDRFEFDAPALAHEAQAVNAVKRNQRFTIVIGNPPYAQYSMNLNEAARAHIERFRFANDQRIRARNALQLERNLNDDYVKFLGFSSSLLPPKSGILGMITNRMFLDSESLVGVREWFSRHFDCIHIVDLWGSSEEARRVVRLSGDENVFDILQGVAISFFVRRRPEPEEPNLVSVREVIGQRQEKYRLLSQNLAMGNTGWDQVLPSPPMWQFRSAVMAPGTAGREFTLPEIFPQFSTLIASNRDHLVVNFDREVVLRNVASLQSFRGSNDELSEEFDITLKTGWNITVARQKLRQIEDLANHVQCIEYRPFDRRWIFFHPTLVWQSAPVVSNNVLGGRSNHILVSLGKNRAETINGHWVSQTLADKSVVSTRDNASGFPLYLYDPEGGLGISGSAPRPNISSDFCKGLADRLGLSRSDPYNIPLGVRAEDIFQYVYALLNSAQYRSCHAESLTTGFPRLPLPGSLDLFRELARLGGELVALHLLESPKLDDFITTYTGQRNPEVERVGWSDNTVWLNSAATKKGQPTTPGNIGFNGVPENVWNFHIGGYQVCEKWLKDRKGRTLSKDDINHYQKIVVALSETIRIMAEIDKVIDAHGGWPGAFSMKQGD